MEVYRLSQEQFLNSLSGKGAALKGARWNSIGVELVYTSANRSLAMAEVAVHLSLGTLPDDFAMATIYIPDSTSIKKVNIADLPEEWKTFPHPSLTQAIGNGFVSEGKFCILQVPSVVTTGDFNYLINPNHPEFKSIKIIAVERFPFDKRIFK